MIFNYSVGESDQLFEYDFYEWENHILSDPLDIYDYEIIFKNIAQEYYWNGEGSEENWPIEFKLFDVDENYLATGKTEIEYLPSFYTHIKKVEKVKNNENL